MPLKGVGRQRVSRDILFTETRRGNIVPLACHFHSPPSSVTELSIGRRTVKLLDLHIRWWEFGGPEGGVTAMDDRISDSHILPSRFPPHV